MYKSTHHGFCFMHYFLKPTFMDDIADDDLDLMLPSKLVCSSSYL